MSATEPARQDTDRDLVAAILRKDRKATADFVALHADAVYRYVNHRLSPRRDLTDDMVQDVFLAAWEKLPEFRFESSLRNWLLAIARHKVEDYYRARLRELEGARDTSDEGSVAEPSSAPGLDEALDRELLRGRTRRVLDGLPEAYAILLQWRYWEKRSTREIAGQTGQTEKAVERMLARARYGFRMRWLHG